MCSVAFIVDVVSACDTSAISLDLKPLPNSLKYAFVGPDVSLPMIIASNLDHNQEGKFLKLLKENKVAIRWTLGDFKSIHPSIVQYRIYLEDNAIPHRDRQRRLNPTL